MNNEEIKKMERELRKYSNKLLDAEFRVFRHEDSSWLIFGKDNNIGYVEYNPIRGWNFSTKHKGNALTGNGFRIYEEIDNPTIQNAYDTFIFVPNWASQKEKASVIKYNGIDDYIQKAHFDYKELKKNKKLMKK